MEKETAGNTELNTESKQGNKSQCTWLKTMAKRPKLVALCVAVVCTVLFKFGQSFHQKQITQSALLPQKFFPTHSGVSDFPFGALQPAIRLLQEEELIFVMYYAPWCAESIAVRSEFIQAAKVMNSVVKFVAINCWWYEGECRERMKFGFYPEIFLYQSGVKDGYRHQGPKTAEYFIKFIESFLDPIHPLYTREDVSDFIAKQDNTVIGYFDFNSSPQPPGTAFRQFYLSALRVMAFDMFQPVPFVVVTSPDLAGDFGLTNPGRMALVRLGYPDLLYPDEMNMTSVNMTNWILMHRQKNYVTWLVPPGLKSLTLSTAINQGPAVLVFAPANPLFPTNTVLQIVRDMAVRYNTCNAQMLDLQKLLDRSYRMESRSVMDVELLRWKCKQKLWEKQPVPFYQSKCCYCLWTGSQTGHQSVCEYCVHKKNRAVEPVCPAGIGSKFMPNFHTLQANSCSNFLPFYNANEFRSLCCKECQINKLPNGVLDSVDKKIRVSTDPYVIYAGRNKIKRQCSKLTLQKVKGHLPESIPSAFRLDKELKTNFTGLKCRTNRTVQFYFLDSRHHSIFTERLGLSSQINDTSVILVDKKNEAHFVLREKFSHESIARFVMNYTTGSLDRHLRSAKASSEIGCAEDLGTACIEEVTSLTFQSIVMDPSKDVVLLYYAPWCGFCSRLAQTYLALKNYFHTAANITFARIDGSTNDLPWEYTVESYPTILFFPKARKSESVVFPDTLEKTMPNLVKFVLHHASLEVQYSTVKGMCSSRCQAANARRLNDVIANLTNQIGKLQRRTQRLWSLAIDDRKYSPEHAKMAVGAIRKLRKVRETQLGTAEILNLFLRTGLHKSDLKVITSYIDVNRK